MLLQATVDGMADVTFTLKDVFYICGLLVSILGGYFSLKNNSKNQAKEIDELKERLLAVKAGKKAMRVDVISTVEKKETVLHKRIDTIRDDLKDFRTKTDDEFRTINSNTSEIKTGLSRVEGMLTQLINK